MTLDEALIMVAEGSCVFVCFGGPPVQMQSNLQGPQQPLAPLRGFCSSSVLQQDCSSATSLQIRLYESYSRWTKHHSLALLGSFNNNKKCAIQCPVHVNVSKRNTIHIKTETEQCAEIKWNKKQQTKPARIINNKQIELTWLAVKLAWKVNSTQAQIIFINELMYPTALSDPEVNTGSRPLSARAQLFPWQSTVTNIRSRPSPNYTLTLKNKAEQSQGTWIKLFLVCSRCVRLEQRRATALPSCCGVKHHIRREWVILSPRRDPHGESNHPDDAHRSTKIHTFTTAGFIRPPCWVFVSTPEQWNCCVIVYILCVCCFCIFIHRWGKEAEAARCWRLMGYRRYGKSVCHIK